MHEVGITRSIIEICEDNARRHGARVVRSVTVEIGDLPGVVPEAVEFCFDACSKGTLLEGAQLIIERVPALGRCTQCHTEHPLEATTFSCPSCDSFSLQRLQGDELKVKEMEID
ncbi:MAG: hydrogenase maturation nickel metallochaperone HypA [Desulfuromonadaceae bacterium]